MRRFGVVIGVLLGTVLVAGAAPPMDDLLAPGAPDEAAVGRLVGRLGDADVATREACIRRLQNYRGAAAPAVAAALAQGKLATKLSAMELLKHWGAPVEGMDPWAAATMTEGRLAAVKNWAASAGDEAPTTQPGLRAADLAEARGDLARMLSVPTEAEAAAIREHLARFGPPLLEEVYAQLKTAPTDEGRRRLTVLRYRLAADEALALNWGDGLVRLASEQAPLRRAAVDELCRRAGPGEEPLLLELFSDPDPLVREMSLRALEALGGDQAAGALVRLLHDPEPNVRAAVLKQLAETPRVELAPAVVEYVAGEKDLDLVVHAVRVLRETKCEASTASLMKLMGHPSWRVRAEAIEALGDTVERYNSPDPHSELFAAMLKALDDDDGFVASRAMAVLHNADTLPEDSLVTAVTRHPELADDLLGSLARSKQPTATAALRKLCQGADPRVRAAAITALVAAAGVEAHEEVQAGLKDKEALVRGAAVEGLRTVLIGLRPTVNDMVAPDAGQWVANFRRAGERPAWVDASAEDVRALLSAPDARQRIAAAVVMVAIGHDEPALGMLRGMAASADAETCRLVATVMPWLPWEPRLEFFNALTARGFGDGDVAEFVGTLLRIPDARSWEPVWKLLGKPDMSIVRANDVYNKWREAMFGQPYSGAENMAAPDRKAAAEFFKKNLLSGNATQRTMGLMLLLMLAPEDMPEMCGKVMADPATTVQGRGEAFQMMLVSEPMADAHKAAVAALTGGDAALKCTAAMCLALGMQRLSVVRGQMYLYYMNPDWQREFYTPGGQAIALEAPRGLTVETVRPLLKAGIPEESACAGYLLALLGNAEGMGVLENYWRGASRDNRDWTRLMYGAIAVLKDDSRVGMLREIYGGLSQQQDRFEIRNFYWTIRSMTGAEVLKLRKQIREDVGMEQLR